eukprot:6406242-Pyramimonas_sp.AAC.1
MGVYPTQEPITAQGWEYSRCRSQSQYMDGNMSVPWWRTRARCRAWWCRSCCPPVPPRGDHPPAQGVQEGVRRGSGGDLSIKSRRP